MNLKKNLSLIVILIFSFVISLAVISNDAKADPATAMNEDGTVYVGENEKMDSENKDDEPSRSQDFYQVDSQTDAYGGTYTQWMAGPDIGLGETLQGYKYTNPLTGASVSFSQTGFGMGQVAAPIYGGINSMLGAASYGPLTQGLPQSQSTYGYNSQSSMSGNAFGQGYQYQASIADPMAQLGMSLIQNPSTMGAGIALMYSGALGNSFGGYSGLGLGSFGGYAPQAAYSGYGGYGYSQPASYGGYGYSYAPQTSYSGYGGYGYSQPASYGGYGYSYAPQTSYSGYGGYGGYGYSYAPQTSYSGYGGYGGYAPAYGSYLY